MQALALHAPQGTTYNLTVETGHTFFVGGLGTWVHNVGPCNTCPNDACNLGATKTGADRIIDEANLVAAPGGEISETQRFTLKQNLPIVQRRDPIQNAVLRKEFERDQNYLTSQWTKNTGNAWPSIVDSNGVTRYATPHHIYPLERALLHKSAVGQDMPNPKWIYAAATVWGVPSAVN